MINIDLNELWWAYRRAKADVWHERTANCARKFAAFESSLEHNLAKFQNTLHASPQNWMQSAEFLGNIVALPRNTQTGLTDGISFSSPDDAWLHRVRTQKPFEVTYRRICSPSVEFYLLSSLWLMRVGPKLDSRLSPACLGNRLRLTPMGDAPSANVYAYTSFKHYASQYERWRERCLTAAENTLERHGAATIITLDFSDYYPSLAPDFLGRLISLRPEFSKEDRELTDLLINAIDAFNLKHNCTGLPIGLPSSNLIANCALTELDSKMERIRWVQHYARYVDDLAIVVDSTKADDSSRFLAELSAATQNMVAAAPNPKHDWAQVHVPLLRHILLISQKKFKLIKLKGSTGEHVLAAMRASESLLASEWRLLPSHSTHNGNSIARLVSISRRDELAHQLRDSDSATVRRLSFALALRQTEMLAAHVEARSLDSACRPFLKTALEFAVSASSSTELSMYWKRLLQLCLLLDRDDLVAEFFSRLDLTLSNLARASKFEEIRLFTNFAAEACQDAIVGADAPNERAATALRLLAFTLKRSDLLIPIRELDTLRQTVFWADLGVRSVVDRVARNCLTPRWPMPVALRVRTLPRTSLRALFRVCTAFLEKRGGANLSSARDLAHRFSLATRPPRVADIHRMHPASFDNPRLVDQAIFECRGVFPFTDQGPQIDLEQVGIALSSIEVTETSWEASAINQPDHSLARFNQLAEIADRAIKLRFRSKTNFVVLPELAIPIAWTALFEDMLGQSGISLIGGVEYDHAPEGVRNTVTVSLAQGDDRYSHIHVRRQQKRQAAVREESELIKLGRQFVTTTEPHRIYDYGGFKFAVFVCSELTDAEERSRLRGAVDAVFVVEFNKDLSTFASLVEATCIDLHAFMIQCNNRLYGDSRIRSPASESYRRDLVQVRGGIDDYLVFGRLPVASLRRAQRGPRDDRKSGYKPTPDGYQMSPGRTLK